MDSTHSTAVQRHAVDRCIRVLHGHADDARSGCDRVDNPTQVRAVWLARIVALPVVFDDIERRNDRACRRSGAIAATRAKSVLPIVTRGVVGPGVDHGNGDPFPRR